MINLFKQIGDLKKMRDEALAIQRELQVEEVEVETRGVRVVATGDQKIKVLETRDRSDEDIREAVNEAIKKAQEVAAKKLSQMRGGLQGLLGG